MLLKPTNMHIAELREEYKQAALDLENLHKDPFIQFENWFQQAMHAELKEPNAMSLATANEQGMPSIRTVLLKYFDHQGFVFFTNYASRKSKDISENAHVALLFPWIDLERQLIIQGKAERISTTESLKYFSSRPKGSQIGAWVSPQSSVITSRSLLLTKFEEMKQKFQQGKIPLPDFWGGFRVIPSRFEFWQGRPNRLHDRFQYKPEGEAGWRIERLAP